MYVALSLIKDVLVGRYLVHYIIIIISYNYYLRYLVVYDNESETKSKSKNMINIFKIMK